MDQNIETAITQFEGVIHHSLSGFYQVWTGDQSFTTKPKGLFRHTKLKPMVGDRVTIEVDLNDPYSQGRMVDVKERFNVLVRPPVVNVDYAIVVMALVEPDFSYGLLDQYLVTLEDQHIQPLILLTKLDKLIELKGDQVAQQIVDTIQSVYDKVGYPVWVKEETELFSQTFKDQLQEGIYITMGQSGAGKSTFLNQLLPQAQIETGDISQSLNRGRHTTRQVTLYPVAKGLVADTPGFSSLELPDIDLDELRLLFPEIRQAGQECKFRSCIHVQEPKCHVKDLVDQGEISPHRYKSYKHFLDKLRENKPY